MNSVPQASDHRMPPAPPRALSRRLLGGVAAAAVAPLVVDVPAAEASEPAARLSAAEARRRRRQRRHRKVCRHWHRCAKHRNHTCRRKHRCPHRLHRAPRRAAQPSTPKPPPTPTPTALHLATRFGYGHTPELDEQMRAAGGPQAWFERQLDPSAVPDPEAEALHTWWTSIDLGVAEIVRRDSEEIEGGWQAMANYQRWCLMRRIVSRRQVLEVMTEFWENHLHVPVHDDGVFPFRADYGRVIRAHALGRFDQMLVAAITHPAMGVSLDNASSTKRAPNENLARELLELHTVGRGQHTEDDVKAAARVLTGYRVRTWSTWEVWYDTASHATGPVSVVGFTHPNAAADGRPVAEAMLTHLARHPATARRIARKLAVRFVRDAPSAALVEHLAGVYLASQTAIAPVLRALVAHPEFVGSAGAKVRTPTDDVVATYRALGARVARPVSGSSAANQILWQAESVGQAPFSWPRPDGEPQDNASWSSVSRLLASFDVHHSLSQRWWPSKEITFRQPKDWLPAATVRLDALVDHLSRRMLGRPATARLQEAARTATMLPAGEQITADHSLVKWHFGVLLTTILDTPEHLHR